MCHRCTRESGVQEKYSPLPRPCRQPPDVPCLCPDLPVSVWTESQLADPKNPKEHLSGLALPKWVVNMCSTLYWINSNKLDNPPAW